jgi:hypothetical protein
VPADSTQIASEWAAADNDLTTMTGGPSAHQLANSTEVAFNHCRPDQKIGAPFVDVSVVVDI